MLVLVRMVLKYSLDFNSLEASLINEKAETKENPKNLGHQTPVPDTTFHQTDPHGEDQKTGRQRGLRAVKLTWGDHARLIYAEI